MDPKTGRGTWYRDCWWWGFALLLVLTALLCLYRLDRGGLRDGDEARYALVAENMADSGNPWTLVYKDRPYYQKSPGRIWLSALTFLVFGVNAWTVRIWSALAAIAAVAVTALTGRNLHGKGAGLLCGFALATMPGFLHVHGARTGEMDTALALGVMLALYPLSRPARRGDPVFIGLAIAYCGLVKHLMFVPIVLALVGLASLSTGSWRDWSRRDLVRGVGLMVLLLAPWFVIQAVRHPRELFHGYFDSVIRQTTVDSPDPDPGPSFYPLALLSGAWPWTITALLGLPLGAAAGRRDRRPWIPILGAVFLLGVVMAAHRKLPWYVLPVYPFLALMTGSLVPKIKERAGAMVLGSVLAAGAAAAWLAGFNTTEFAAHPGYQVPMDADFLARRWSVAAVAVVLAAGTVGWAAARFLRGRAWRWAAPAVCAAALGAFALGNALHPLAHPYPGLWQRIQAAIEEAGVPWENVMIVVPPARGRDDVRRFYERRLNRGMGGTDIPTAAARAATPGFRGAVVARPGDVARLGAALRPLGPGLVMTPLVRTSHLHAWELSRP